MAVENDTPVYIPEYDSPAQARGYAEELNYAIANPEEEGLTPEQVKTAREELRMIRLYLAGAEEPI